MQMLKNLSKKLLESALAILPIALLVIFVSIGLPELDWKMISLFAFGAIMLTIGMAFFTLGADMAIMEIGREIGANVATSNKKWTIFLVPLVMGFFAAFSEPDIQVLGELFQTVPGQKNMTIIIVVSVAVAVMLLISILRANYGWSLRIIILVFYTIIFILAIFAEIYAPNFVSTAFDSGGIATGPMTVPFLLAFGIGFANAKGGKNQSQNSFGVLGLATAGPILAVLMMALIMSPNVTSKATEFTVVSKFSDIFSMFGKALPPEFKLVSIALAPTLIIFLIFQFVYLKLPRQTVIRILMGVVYTFLGLSIFLAAVNSCFMPIGQKLGYVLGTKSFKYVLIPLGIAIGAMIVLAEPSIHILTRQVDELTAGAISRKFMLIALCTGIGLAVGLAMLRVLTGIKIWWFLAPTYAISIGLMFVVKPVFTAIAFDSGSVASGAMAATFVLPFALGASGAIGGNPLLDAFGLIAFVSMTPILTLQLMGLVFKIKMGEKHKKKLVVVGTQNIDITHEQVLEDTSSEIETIKEDITLEPFIEEIAFDDYGDEPIDFEEFEEDTISEKEMLDADLDQAINFEKEMLDADADQATNFEKEMLDADLDQAINFEKEMLDADADQATNFEKEMLDADADQATNFEKEMLDTDVDQATNFEKEMLDADVEQAINSENKSEYNASNIEEKEESVEFDEMGKFDSEQNIVADKDYQQKEMKVVDVKQKQEAKTVDAKDD